MVQDMAWGPSLMFMKVVPSPVHLEYTLHSVVWAGPQGINQRWADEGLYAGMVVTDGKWVGRVGGSVGRVFVPMASLP